MREFDRNREAARLPVDRERPRLVALAKQVAINLRGADLGEKLVPDDPLILPADTLSRPGKALRRPRRGGQFAHRLIVELEEHRGDLSENEVFRAAIVR
jgi:hypothetical protein